MTVRAAKASESAEAKVVYPFRLKFNLKHLEHRSSLNLVM